MPEPTCKTCRFFDENDSPWRCRTNPPSLVLKKDDFGFGWSFEDAIVSDARPACRFHQVIGAQPSKERKALVDLVLAINRDAPGVEHHGIRLAWERAQEALHAP